MKNRAPFAVQAGRLVPLLLAITAALAVGNAHANDPKASRFYEDALTRFEQKDMAGAVIQLKNALKIDKSMLPVHVLLGRALLANGEVVAAEVALMEAIRLGVNSAEVVLPLAEAVLAQGRPAELLSGTRFAHAALPPGVKAKLLLFKAGASSDVNSGRDALRFVEEARAIDGTKADSWVAEVPIRVRARQMAEAKAAADRAVAMDPTSADAAYQQATVAHVTGDLKSAIAMYTRTLTLKAGHVDALIARAGIYVDLKRDAEASADVAAARKAGPSDPRAHYLGALIAERAGNQNLVKSELAAVTNLLDTFPIDFHRYRPQLLMLGGLSHFGLGQYEKAKPYLETAMRQDINSPVSKLLAPVHLREKNTDRAIEALETYLRNHANDMQAVMLLASAHMSQGRYARSAALMQEALKRADQPEMRSILGVSLLGAGKFALAASELEATLKRDPTQVQAGVALAGLYLKSGQSDKAIPVIDGMIKRQPDNAGLHDLLGAARAAKGDAAGARAAFDQAAKLAPTFVSPRLNLARLDIDQKAYDAAQAKLETILLADGKNAEASLEMARLLSGRGQAEEAQRWLEKADDYSGQNLAAGTQLVEFHLARSRPDLAAEALKRLQAKAPEALIVLLTQAKVQIAAGDRSAARTTLTRAATLAAFDAAALVQVASLQMRAGNVKGAGYALDKALSEKPQHLQARALMTDVELHQGEYGKAEQRARGIIASDPKLGIGYALLGDTFRARNQLPAAIESYRRAHQIDQNSDSVLRLFGALEAHDRAAAGALAEQWLRSRPGDGKVRRALADSQARAGNLVAARATYEALVKTAPGDFDALNNLANILVLLKDPGALAVAERALALRPDAPYVIGTTGWAAFHAGQSDRALQLLRDARLRDPNNPDTRYFLAAALAKKGRAGEAREELQAALKGGRFAYAKEADALLQTLK